MRFIVGFILCFYFVVMPLKANIMASIAFRSGLDQQGQAQLLENATAGDKCSVPILERAGDMWFTAKNFYMAAYSYGRAMACSPGYSVARFKYGESVLAIGSAYGLESIRDSIKLEPNNPYYQKEKKRITALLWPSR